MDFKEYVKTMDKDVESWSKEDTQELLSNLDIEDLEDVLSSLNVTDINTAIKYIETLDDMEKTSIIEEIINIYEEYEDSSNDRLDDLDEKMSQKAKLKAKKNRKTFAFKKAKRLKAKCQKKYKDRINKSKDNNIPMVCGVDGKLHKGMKKLDRIKLRKTRKRNKSKIID